MRWLLGWCYIFAQRSADESQSERNSCPLLRSLFIGSRHVGVSKRFLCSISLEVCYPSCYTFFWLIRSLVDPTVTSFIVCSPLQFVLLIYIGMYSLKGDSFSAVLVINREWFLHSSLDMGMLLRRSHFCITNYVYLNLISEVGS